MRDPRIDRRKDHDLIDIPVIPVCCQSRGGKSTVWYGAGAGGVACVGSSDDNADTPRWVFADTHGDSKTRRNA